jgi:hypothetical protein
MALSLVLLFGVSGCTSLQTVGDWSRREQHKWNEILSPLVDPNATAVTSRGQEIANHLNSRKSVSRPPTRHPL